MVSINPAAAPASPKATYASVVAGERTASTDCVHPPVRAIRKVVLHVKSDNHDDSSSVATDSDNEPLDSVASRIAAANAAVPSNDSVLSAAASGITARHTRSTAGLKRVIEDAGLVCSDEELPAQISPPKKIRTSVALTATESNAVADQISDSSDSSIEVIQVVDNSADARYRKGIAEAILVEDSSSDEMVLVQPTRSESSKAKSIKQKGKRTPKTRSQSVRIKQEPGTVVKDEPASVLSSVSVVQSEVSVKQEPVDVLVPIATDSVASVPVRKEKGKSSNSKKTSTGVRRSARRAEAAIEQIEPETSDTVASTPPTGSNSDLDSNPFLPSPEVILGAKIQGKGKSIRIVLPSGPIDLHEEEALMFAQAVRESRLQHNAPTVSNNVAAEPSSSKLLKTLDEAYARLSRSDLPQPMVLDPPLQLTSSASRKRSKEACADVSMADPDECADSPFIQDSIPTGVVQVDAVIDTPPTPVTPVRAPRKFKDVIPAGPVNKKASLGLNGPVLMEDIMRFTVKQLPKKCEVTKTDLQDSLLEDTYTDLPNLQHGILKLWNSHNVMAPVDCVSFSLCGENFPEMNFDNAYDAVTFVKSKNCINPSRVSPLDVSILYMGNDRKHATLQCNSVPAICLSAILTRDSYLLEPTSKGLCNKYLSGHMVHQEWERFAGFACMAFGHQVMVASIRDKAITFGTMGVKSERESITPSKPPRTPGILSGQKDAKLQGTRKAVKPSTRFKTMLDSTDTIPIYDSRNYPFNFKNDFDRLDEVLPRWRRGEIPANSFVMVAYTMTQYEKERSFHLCTNIQYAIVFGTEHDTSDIEAEHEALEGLDYN